MNPTAPPLKRLALVLIVLGLLASVVCLAALAATRESSWRFGVACGALAVFVGCCLWHVARLRGGAR